MLERHNVIRKEKDLPFYFVYYPRINALAQLIGTFPAFSIDKKHLFLCSCMRGAVEYYIGRQSAMFRFDWFTGKYKDVTHGFIIGADFFPKLFVKYIIDKGAPCSLAVLDFIEYKDACCHRCLQIVPHIEAIEMYIQLKLFENRFIPDYKYQALLNKMSVMKDCLSSVADTELQLDFRHEYNLAYYQYLFDVEDDVRAIWGLNAQKWVTQYKLFKIIKEVLPDEVVLYQRKPHFMNGLQLDIYLPDLKLAIEYQGEQHDFPFAHWGGEDALLELRERDSKKASICRQRGINLICFGHYETIDIKNVRTRLKDYL